jgi:hypothetical protein
MTDTPAVAAARIEVARRRGDLLDTVHEIQARLAPRILAADAWQKAKNKGADLAEDAVDAVKARPAAAGGIAAAIGLFLARAPIRDAAVKIYDAMASRREAKTARDALQSQKPKQKDPRGALDERTSLLTETAT